MPEIPADTRVKFKPSEAQIEIEIPQLLQFWAEQIRIPVRLFVAAVVHEPVRFDLRGRETRGDVNWDLCQPQFFRGEQPGVTTDDDAVFIDDNRLTPAELLQAGRDFIDGTFRNLCASCARKELVCLLATIALQDRSSQTSGLDLDLSEGPLCGGLSNRSAAIIA